MTPVGFEPTPFRNGALSHRLRPLGQSVHAICVASLCLRVLGLACFHSPFWGWPCWHGLLAVAAAQAAPGMLRLDLLLWAPTWAALAPESQFLKEIFN